MLPGRSLKFNDVDDYDYWFTSYQILFRVALNYDYLPVTCALYFWCYVESCYISLLFSCFWNFTYSDEIHETCSTSNSGASSC